MAIIFVFVLVLVMKIALLVVLQRAIKKIHKTRKARWSTMMPSPSLRIYLWPHVIWNFELLHPGCSDTTGIYHNICQL